MASNGIGDLGQFDFMNKGMYPMSQIDRSYYSAPTQAPLAAQAAASDYDPETNPLTGEPVARFAQGGIAIFAKGGSPFQDDPNNFAADLTKAYKATLGRDPSTEELRANVDALNKNPDAYAFIVDQLASDPSAAKFYTENTTPQFDEAGNAIDVPAYDADQTAMGLKSAYGKFTPTPEHGGIQGFANKIGRYAQLLMAAVAVATPYLAGTAATEGVLSGAAVPLSEITGSTFGGSAFALPESVAAGADVFGGLAGTEGAYGGLTAAEQASALTGATGGVGPTYAEMGYLGANAPETAAAIAKADAAAKLAGAGGMTAKQLMAANMGLKTLAGAMGGASGQGGTSGNSGISQMQTPSQQYIQPSMLAQQKYGELYRPYTYDYTRHAAQGGVMYANGGGISTLGSYSDGGQLLKGAGDGMSDDIPAHIGGDQPAALADGEFVIPADVVSHLGNGSTDAGAKQLYKMMDRIREARTGNSKQGKQINPDKFLPKG